MLCYEILLNKMLVSAPVCEGRIIRRAATEEKGNSLLNKVLGLSSCMILSANDENYEWTWIAKVSPSERYIVYNGVTYLIAKKRLCANHRMIVEILLSPAGVTRDIPAFNLDDLHGAALTVIKPLLLRWESACAAAATLTYNSQVQFTTLSTDSFITVYLQILLSVIRANELVGFVMKSLSLEDIILTNYTDFFTVNYGTYCVIGQKYIVGFRNFTETQISVIMEIEGINTPRTIGESCDSEGWFGALYNITFEIHQLLTKNRNENSLKLAFIKPFVDYFQCGNFACPIKCKARASDFMTYAMFYVSDRYLREFDGNANNSHLLNKNTHYTALRHWTYSENLSFAPTPCSTNIAPMCSPEFYALSEFKDVSVLHIDSRTDFICRLKPDDFARLALTDEYKHGYEYTQKIINALKTERVRYSF